MPGQKQVDKASGTSQLDLWGEKHDQQWQEFKVAREYVRSLKLNDESEWKEFVNKKEFQRTNIPGNPDQAYKHSGWKDWHDWLDIEDKMVRSQNQSPDNILMNSLWSTNARSKWMNFFEARQIVWEYGFEYEEEWRIFIDGKFPDREALPDKIPANPDQVYRFVGWKDWKDWLIHPDNRTDYTEFYKARDFVRSNRIPDKESWRDFLQKETGLTEKYQMALPVRPHLEYRDSGWNGWEDWFGSEICYHEFAPTRKFVYSLKLRNQKEWMEFCHGRLPHKPKKTDNIYTYPEIAYKNEGWKDWEDWLGTSKVKIVNPNPQETEVTIDCKCKGRIKDCPDCIPKLHPLPPY
jgi:hypothetical protein